MNATSLFINNGLQTFKSQDPWSSEVMALWLPVAAYWVYSITFHFIMKAEIPFFEQYRIHTINDLSKRNKVSVSRVISMVTLQHIIQIALGMIIMHPTDPVISAMKQDKNIQWWFHIILSGLNHLDPHHHYTHIRTISLIAKTIHCIVIPCIRFLVAMLVMDAHQYFLHRLFHMNKFLYKHIHSHHHRLYVPYAFGALYNHPIEGFLFDSVGASLAFELSGMSSRSAMLFFTFSTIKTVDDHCGYALPWDPLQFLFGNNVQYHDIHHQQFGIKKNFSQPFFTFWDKLLGTEMTMSEARKKGAYKHLKSN
ncbi:fatty acid hydroxylase superfamily-domain-containing protein [Pilobolus umbonatus]|nr:fatty acid hydroxylase superfamily-domain-containing protein [Pilobolus umbonatus]